jgi:hypothetical protein
MSHLAAIIISFFVWPFTAMWRAYVIIVLWGWFVVPATSIQAPSIYLVVGMMMTLHMMLPYPRYPKEEGDALANYLSNLIVYGGLAPAAFLGLGWVWKWLQWGVV